MRYLCMVCYEQKVLDSLSKPEFDALVAESLAYDDELRNGGHYLYSGALQSVQTATTIRIKSGGTSSPTDHSLSRRSRSAGLLSSKHTTSMRRSASLPRSRRSDSGASRSARSRNSNHIVNNALK